MASLSSLYIKTETLETLVKTLKKKKGKEGKGIELTISLQDETNDYGQNLSAFVSQSKEDREAKKDRFYVGNGKNFWNDGDITTAEKVETETTSSEASDDDDDDTLPF